MAWLALAAAVALALQGGRGVVGGPRRLRVAAAHLVPRGLKRAAVMLGECLQLAEGLRSLVALLVQPDIRAALLVVELDAERLEFMA